MFLLVFVSEKYIIHFYITFLYNSIPTAEKQIKQKDSMGRVKMTEVEKGAYANFDKV